MRWGKPAVELGLVIMMRFKVDPSIRSKIIFMIHPCCLLAELTKLSLEVEQQNKWNLPK